MKRRKVRENFGNGKQRPRLPGRIFRLGLEPLESRRLLASLNVNIFIDQNGSRSSDGTDSVAANRMVYLDLNRNGSQDAAEPLAISNNAGVAQFFGLNSGEYSVALADGNATQSQSFPTRPDDLGKLIEVPAVDFLASADLARVWSFDSLGLGKRLRGDGGPISSVNLGGPISTSLQVSANEAWVITENRSGGPSQLTHFDVVSGQHISQAVVGLNGRVISKLVKAGPQIVAQLSGPSGTELAGLSLVNGEPTIGASALFPTLATFSGSPTSPELVVVLAPGYTTFNPTWQLARVSAVNFAQTLVKPLTSSLSEVAYSADNQFVLAAQESGGVQVYSNNLQLSQVAVLSEATAPLVAHSRDGRFVTGSSLSAGELITWQVSGWIPVGRTLASPGITRTLVSSDGDELLTATPAGVVEAHLANAAPVQVLVGEELVAEITFGVRLEGTNTDPPTDTVVTEVLEDTAVSGELRTAVIDVDGDEVWFTALSAPRHGKLELSSAGSWLYKPAANFFGQDTAIVKVFDGQASSEFPLRFNILAVDDAPTGAHVDVMPIPENSTSGRAAGQIEVDDIDGGTYQFVVSDPRFVVDNNRLSVAPNAVFNFEAEPFITLEIFASEDSASGYHLSTTATLAVLDVNEPPTRIRIISEGDVPENQLGALVGSIKVDDPDSTNNFTYFVSDSRFEVKNGNLQLKPNVALDFESADAVNLTIAVSDESGQTVENTVTVSVTNRNDPPTGINVVIGTVYEKSQGVVVGSIRVQDQDQQQYNYTLSDNRFEVVDGQIKLKNGETLDKVKDALINLTVTATDSSGSSVSTRVDVKVDAKLPAFQNPNEPCDVNDDGVISPLDALLVLNRLNKGARTLRPDATPGASGESPHLIDVNGDGAITPIDLLMIINYLNARSRNTVAPSPRVKVDPPAGSSANAPAAGATPSSGPEVTSTLSIAGSNDAPLAAPSSAEGEGPEAGETSPVGLNTGFACSAVEQVSDSMVAVSDELETLLEPLSRERLRSPRIST